MSRDWSIFAIIFSGLLSVSLSAAYAQKSAPTQYFKCDFWRAPWVKKGTKKIQLFPIEIAAAPRGGSNVLKGEIQDLNKKYVSGVFLVSQITHIAIWGQTEEGGRVRITTQNGKTLTFIADDGTKQIEVGYGFLNDFPPMNPSSRWCEKTPKNTMADTAEPSGAATIIDEGGAVAPGSGWIGSIFRSPSKAESTAPSPEGRERSSERGYFPGVPLKRLGEMEILADKIVTAPGPRAPASGPKTLEELANNVVKPTESVHSSGALGKVATPDNSRPAASGNLMSRMAAAERKPENKVEKEASKPTAPHRGSPAAAMPHICRADNLEPLATMAHMDYKSAQPVGIRNRQTAADGYDYIGPSGDLISLNRRFDISESAGKVLPYKAVNVSGGQSDKLWVSTGVKPIAAKRATPAPQNVLRLVIAGGAQEVAISGLEAVGSELKKLSGGKLTIDAAWHIVDVTGATMLVSHYDSLESLVEDAAARSGNGRPAVLDEPGIMRFFAEFQKILVDRRDAIDKVFWIKGAYAIPSSIPKRFEEFLKNVSVSDAIVHAPGGAAGNWFVVVTARIPGFSTAYLQEPISSLKAGDVIEEPDAGNFKPNRRLIGNPALVAARLNAAALMRPTAAANASLASDNTDAVADTLVHEAGEIFSERGYLLSHAATLAMQKHLELVVGELTFSERDPNRLAKVKTPNGKIATTLAELLESFDEKSGFKLPKTVPAWMRAPFRDLTENDVISAESFTQHILKSTTRIGVTFKEIAAKHANCDLVYVSDRALGLGEP